MCMLAGASDIVSCLPPTAATLPWQSRVTPRGKCLDPFQSISCNHKQTHPHVQALILKAKAQKGITPSSDSEKEGPAMSWLCTSAGPQPFAAGAAAAPDGVAM